MDVKRQTTALINAASILEKCEEQILPALYSKVGASFNATPTQLGNITLARSFMQALASPFAGIASHFMPRGTVICLGCIIWSTFTVLFACTSSITVALPLCAINGIGLALVIPSVQSLTADYNAAEARGRAFGHLWLVISLGGMIGAVYATNMGALQPFGIAGWRFTFFSVAVASVVVGVLNAMYVHDPTYAPQQLQQQSHTQLQGNASTVVPPKLNAALLRSTFVDIGSVMRIPTFAIIIVQGIIGSVPYASLVFLTLYLQLLGMSDAAASGIVATYLIFGGFGGLLGGWIGDTVAHRYPNHGRVAATQFSVASGIPFAFLIFKGLPMNGDAPTVALYFLVFALFSLATAWPAPCANNPIFSEIVPVRLRNLIYAFDRCFEGAVAAFATPFVGALSQHIFGFSGTSTVTGDPAVDVPNARALGNALLLFSVIPWTFCLLAYSGLHFTYPKDKRLAVALDREKSISEGSCGGGGGDGEEEEGNLILAAAGGEAAVVGGGGGGGRGSLLLQRPPPHGSSAVQALNLGSSSSGGVGGGSYEERLPLAGGGGLNL